MSPWKHRLMLASAIASQPATFRPASTPGVWSYSSSTSTSMATVSSEQSRRSSSGAKPLASQADAERVEVGVGQREVAGGARRGAGGTVPFHWIDS